MEETIYHPISGKLIKLSDLDDQSAFINDRLFKPDVWQEFYYDKNDKANKTFGIEIELNTPADVTNNPKGRINICKELLGLLNRDGRHFHIMRDNSVRNGIELVSAPMTYKYWTEMFNVKEVNDLFRKLQLTATVDTGLHIHVGETHTRRLREVYLQLFAISYPMWVHLSDRRFKRLQERYVSTNYFLEKPGLKNRFDASLKSLINNSTSKVNYEGLHYYDYDIKDRYLGLNFFNKNTIEFRMFAGTNNTYDIFKYLTFVNIITKMVKDISDTRVNDVFDLDTFVKRSKSEMMLKELITYLKFINSKENKKRIYKNYFMFLDAYWYRLSLNHVNKRDLALKKDVYADYLKIIEKIDPKNPKHDCSETLNLKKDIDLLLINELLEVVIVDKEDFYLTNVSGLSKSIKLNKVEANKDYVFLRGISDSLIIKD